jgi:hypothetical protein
MMENSIVEIDNMSQLTRDTAYTTLLHNYSREILKRYIRIRMNFTGTLNGSKEDFARSIVNFVIVNQNVENIGFVTPRRRTLPTYVTPPRPTRPRLPPTPELNHFLRFITEFGGDVEIYYPFVSREQVVEASYTINSPTEADVTIPDAIAVSIDNINDNIPLATVVQFI